MSILIKKTGLLDTFQDLGRNGFRRFGINPNGAMDKTAVRLINILLGNDENEAVLELHFPAGEIVFEERAGFAIGGADFGAELNSRPIDNWQIHTAKPGDSLRFTQKRLGNRTYLSVSGGFQLQKWLGSASTNMTAEVGGYEGRRLMENDRIAFNLRSVPALPNSRIGQSLIPRYSNSPTVRILTGAEWPDLTALSEQVLTSDNFKVSQASNRMGFRLKGRKLHLLNGKELVSTAVDFGTIQLLPDGQMIILMADHQTTGGYPRIAHIIVTDLPLTGQLGAGDSLGFHIISASEAENLQMQTERDLSFLKAAIKLLRF